MDTRKLVTLLAGTEFAARYYRLCDRFPPRPGDPGRCSKRDVLGILAALGRTPAAELRGRAFVFEWPAGGWAASCGFILQHREVVEFWCSLDRSGVRVGDNLTGLARGATEATGQPARDPPYPRPVYRAVGELREVLAELFVLADLVVAVGAEPEAEPLLWPTDLRKNEPPGTA
ncbi:MAG: hypothetical protein JWO38_8008 [Gemmataceae bacterium]|nr:hypothetical protein [Gemmataceae bacterium]